MAVAPSTTFTDQVLGVVPPLQAGNWGPNTSNQYFTPWPIYAATTNGLGNATGLTLYPMIVPNPCNISFAQFRVDTAGSTGSGAEVSIWADNGFYHAGRLLGFGSGISGTGTGVVNTGTINANITRPGLHWLGFRSVGGYTMSFTSYSALMTWTAVAGTTYLGTPSNGRIVPGYQASTTATPALPNNVSTVTLTNSLSAFPAVNLSINAGTVT